MLHLSHLSSKILPSEKSGLHKGLRKLDEDGCMYLAYHRLDLPVLCRLQPAGFLADVTNFVMLPGC